MCPSHDRGCAFAWLARPGADLLTTYNAGWYAGRCGTGWRPHGTLRVHRGRRGHRDSGRPSRHRSGEVSGVRSVETVLALVVLATVVAAFAKRLRIPAPSLLVAAGLVVGLLPGVPPGPCHARRGQPRRPAAVALRGERGIALAGSARCMAPGHRTCGGPGADVRWCGRPGCGGRGSADREHGIRSRRGAREHGPGRGDRARAAPVAAEPGAGARAGREPVQRRDQPGALPDRGLARRGRDRSRDVHGHAMAARHRPVHCSGGRRRARGWRDRGRGRDCPQADK